MRPVDFKQVRQLVSMRVVLSLIGWTPVRREPSSERGRCPLCKRCSKDGRNFEVANHKWHCWKCRRGGNHLDLYAAFVGKPLLEAAIELCEKAGVAVPYLSRPAPQPRNPATEKRHP